MIMAKDIHPPCGINNAAFTYAILALTMTSDIILTTANARYSHSAFALKRLWTALGAMKDRARIVEFTIQHDPFEIAETLLRAQPKVVGLGLYIWNVDLLMRVARIIRTVRPEIFLVAGGPEVTPASPFMHEVDYMIVGEGEKAFADLAQRVLTGVPPQDPLIIASPPRLEKLPTPYDAYTDEDIRHRMLYVESARGCPYRCAFCLSSRDAGVRYFPLPPFFDDMTRLLERGARQFKFTDRTFNLSAAHAHAILEFFLERHVPDLRLHFEIMPDRLDAADLELMARFAPGQLHLEIGVQSVNAQTQQRIGRNQNIDKTFIAIERLLCDTGALLHADLIVGLPGDDLDDIAQGFNALVRLGVQEIQIGLLKRLSGTAIDGALGEGLRFDAQAPYEVLQTQTLSFEQIQALKRLARYFDLYYNRGNFPESLALLWQTAPSHFAAFSELSDYVWRHDRRAHKLPLEHLAQRLYEYLAGQGRQETDSIAATIEADYRSRPGRKDKLRFLR